MHVFFTLCHKEHVDLSLAPVATYYSGRMQAIIQVRCADETFRALPGEGSIRTWPQRGGLCRGTVSLPLLTSFRIIKLNPYI